MPRDAPAASAGSTAVSSSKTGEIHYGVLTIIYMAVTLVGALLFVLQHSFRVEAVEGCVIRFITPLFLCTSSLPALTVSLFVSSRRPLDSFLFLFLPFDRCLSLKFHSALTLLYLLNPSTILCQHPFFSSFYYLSLSRLPLPPA